MSELAEWDSFYIIVGPAAGALIGLQFVVMTLIAERPPLRAPDAGAAFATPTIVHFSAILLLSAVLRAPWETVVPAAVLWGVMGLSGFAYTLVVGRRIQMQTVYKPTVEDWLFHILLPLAAYAALAFSSLAAHGYAREALFAVGAAAVLLLFGGIHNAWDAIAYMSLVEVPRREEGRSDQNSADKEKPK
jgi:hypothetical protein